MKSWITSPQVTELLDALYADAGVNDPLARQAAEAAEAAGEHPSFKGMRKAYMAVGPEFGRLLYNLARTTRAKTIVEFGTSFGVSTIHLAAAIRDNGGGKVIATEFDAEKAERALQNLAKAGVAEFVDLRVGDALQTLAELPSEIDMIFLDGAKHMYYDVLRLLEPNLRSGGVVASDNTDHEGMEAFLDYLRNPANGYTSAAILTGRGRGHEITLRN